jgi:hypothetical protein
MTSWGTIGNRLSYEFLTEHESNWETREIHMRNVQPNFKNTTKDRKKYETSKSKIDNYYDEVIEKRLKVLKMPGAEWSLDVERDEGAIFEKIKDSEEDEGALVIT